LIVQLTRNHGPIITNPINFAGISEVRSPITEVRSPITEIRSPITEIRSPIAEGSSLINEGTGLPRITIAKFNLIMEQWNNGGPNFRPLKEWCQFNPNSYREFKDAYSMRKTIALRVLQFADISAFLRNYPTRSLKEMKRQIVADNAGRT
jgi:hypothetical protein